MDTSKEYIKMCERAEEIQKSYRNGEIEWERDDVIAIYDNHWIIYIRCLLVNTSGIIPFDGHIFLPRQDQLQEMIQEKYEMKLAGNYQMLYHLLHFADLHKFDDWSMEQLWLAFVMEEKYKKVWNGEKWEAQK